MSVTTVTTLRRHPGRALSALLVSLAVVVAGCSSGSSHATAETTTQAATTAPGASTSTPTDTQLATEAYVWGYPLVVTERTLQLFGLATPVNQLRFQPTLSDASSRSVVAPNADTLYAIAPLDLRGGPLVLTVPAIHDRYYAFQFMSAYTDSFAYVGTRATGGEAGSWVITPPGWTGTLPAGAHRISAPTPQVVLLGRFLVDGKADVANVHALGTHISLQPLSTVTGAPAGAPPPALGAPKGSAQAVARAGLGFYDELGDALAINPPVDAYERATVARFARLGIGPGRHPSSEVHDPAVRAALLAGITKGEAQLTVASGKAARSVDGWVVSTNAGSYGHDALTRAVVAKIGWGANIPVEAMYPHAVSDPTGGALDGAHRYVIHFPAGGLPPVKAFWSITLYGPDHFFVPNPINRFAIGDRTKGLQHGTGGSLDLYLQHDPPPGHEANWLPTPVSGPFYLSLRLYLPEQPILDLTYRYPTIQRTD